MKEKLGKIKWEVAITIIVSLSSVFVAIKANNIYKMQAEIAKNSALPMIEVDEKVEESSWGDWDKSSIVEISNLSGKMNNYQSSVITFLDCGYFESETAEYKNVEIPIQGYYLLSIKEGGTTGIIERKESIGNYSEIEKLKQEITQFNKENGNGKRIDPLVRSYLKISYLDLLNEQQELYYLLDTVNVKMIELESGQEKFDKYRMLIEKGFYIDTNSLDKVSVNEVLDNIEKIFSLGDIDSIVQNRNETGEIKMSILNEPIVNTVIGAFIGIIASIFGGWIVFKQQKREQEGFTATILYNDLKHLENYLADERSSVNLRCSNNWQQVVAKCTFLKNEEVAWIYMIYDEAYNFNYRYKLKERAGSVRKEDIDSYKKLQRAMFDTTKGYPDFKKYSGEYNELLKNLHNRMKR